MEQGAGSQCWAFARRLDSCVLVTESGGSGRAVAGTGVMAATSLPYVIGSWGHARLPLKPSHETVEPHFTKGLKRGGLEQRRA